MTSLAPLAALLADPVRERMLAALMSGEAMTAGELARVAGLGASSASAHLARLTNGGLVAVTRIGRHRWHRLAGAEVAGALEALGVLAAATGRRWTHGPEFRALRLCWDHLAGERAVGLLDGLLRQGWLVPVSGGHALSAAGERGLAAAGVDLARARAAPRLAPDCMDWSERRPHLGGDLGREIAACCLRRGWLLRPPASADDPFARRRLAPTPEGRRQFAMFGAPG